MPLPAPPGKLLCSVTNAQNDGAAVELARVDCLEAALRELLDDPTFKINRAGCAHHKLGAWGSMYLG